MTKKINMKKKLTVQSGYIPKPLTYYESILLCKRMHLPGWQFDNIIRPRCVLIQQTNLVVDIYNPDKAKWSIIETVSIYGLMGVIGETEQRGIANFFIRHTSELYQCSNIEDTLNILEILRKDYRRNSYLKNKLKDKKSLIAA